MNDNRFGEHNITSLLLSIWRSWSCVWPPTCPVIHTYTNTYTHTHTHSYIIYSWSTSIFHTKDQTELVFCKISFKFKFTARLIKYFLFPIILHRSLNLYLLIFIPLILYCFKNQDSDPRFLIIFLHLISGHH